MSFPPHWCRHRSEWTLHAGVNYRRSRRAYHPAFCPPPPTFLLIPGCSPTSSGAGGRRGQLPSGVPTLGLPPFSSFGQRSPPNLLTGVLDGSLIGRGASNAAADHSPGASSPSINPTARNRRQGARGRAPRGRGGRREPTSSRGGSSAGRPGRTGIQVPDTSLDGASAAATIRGGSSAVMSQRGGDGAPARGRGRSGAALRRGRGGAAPRMLTGAERLLVVQR